MRFLISGYYGFDNAGDEAVLASILEGLGERFPGGEACVLSGDPESTTRLHGVRAAQRWSFGGVWRELGRADLLLQGGGGLIQDATSLISPIYYLGILRLARLRRVPSVIFAQGFGPVRSGLVKRLARAELSRVAAVSMRDPESAEKLTQLGIGRGGALPVVEVTADPALLLTPDPQRARDLLGSVGVTLSAPMAVVTARHWPGAEGVLAALTGLIRWLGDERGFQVVVAPFHQPEDLELARALARAHAGAVVVEEVRHPRELLCMIALAHLAVSMRLHGLIFAASQAVPAVGLSYDPKVEAFCRRAAQPVLDATGCTAEDLLSATEELLRSAEAGASERVAVAGALRRDAQKSFHSLETLLALRESSRGVQGPPA